MTFVRISYKVFRRKSFYITSWMLPSMSEEQERPHIQQTQYY